VDSISRVNNLHGLGITKKVVPNLLPCVLWTGQRIDQFQWRRTFLAIKLRRPILVSKTRLRRHLHFNLEGFDIAVLCAPLTSDNTNITISNITLVLFRISFAAAVIGDIDYLVTIDYAFWGSAYPILKTVR
jgi:hypothetical protein